jgi:predicted dehydrogenase
LNGRVKIGMIGCGRAAELLYVPALVNLSGVRLVAVADPRPERCRAVASHFRGCREYLSTESLLKENGVDGLLVLTPPECHIPPAIESLNSGIPVLVEKPLASSTVGLDQLGEAESRSGAFVMVGYNRRYWDPVQKLKRVLQTASPLAQFQVRMIMTSNVQAWQPICGSGDLLEDLASHQFDLLMHLFEQRISWIRAAEDGFGGLQIGLEMGGSVRANCRISYATPSREEIEMSANGRSFRLTSRSERIEPSNGGIRESLDLLDRFLRAARRKKSSLKASYRVQLLRFAEAIRSRQKPEAGLEQGAAVVRAVEAARQSLKTRRKVRA